MVSDGNLGLIQSSEIKEELSKMHNQHFYHIKSNIDDENISKKKIVNYFQLNFDKYSQNIDLNELESKRFEDLSDYQSDLTFEPLLYELPIMEQDSVFKINRNRWHENQDDCCMVPHL